MAPTIEFGTINHNFSLVKICQYVYRNSLKNSRCIDNYMIYIILAYKYHVCYNTPT